MYYGMGPRTGKSVRQKLLNDLVKRLGLKLNGHNSLLDLQMAVSQLEDEILAAHMNDSMSQPIPMLMDWVFTAASSGLISFSDIKRLIDAHIEAKLMAEAAANQARTRVAQNTREQLDKALQKRAYRQ